MHRRKRLGRRFHRRTSPGAAPGTLSPDPAARAPVVEVLAYGGSALEERRFEGLAVLAELPRLLANHRVTWVNVVGLGSTPLIEGLARQFGLHHLAVEDAVNLHQRAKVEHYGDHLFIVARMSKPGEHFEAEQVSMFLGSNFVLTLIEDPGDSFDPVRQRARQNAGMLCQSGPDHLAYALIDAVVDHYFPLLERYGEALDHLEDQVLERPTGATLAHIHVLKHELLSVRRAIWPHREALSVLAREQSPLVTAETQVYLRDCYDHVVQIMDLLETYRELGSDLRDAYLSSVSNRMNEVMRVLTVISTIFIPLTFITSVYGMNFDTHASRWNMPELRWGWGYAMVWGAIVALTVGMLYFFARRGWLAPFSPANLPGAAGSSAADTAGGSNERGPAAK